MRKGSWEEAIQNYKMALHHDKTLFEVYINLSTTYLKNKKYQQAFKTLEELKSMQPRNPMLHYNLACYYSLIGNIDIAIKLEAT